MSQTVLLGDKVIAHLTSSCATSLNGELCAIACGQLEAFPWLHIVAVGNLSLNPQVCFISRFEIWSRLHFQKNKRQKH